MRFQTLTIRARLVVARRSDLLCRSRWSDFSICGSFWQASRAQLDESLERQAQLAATAFEQRFLAHRQTLADDFDFGGE